MVHTEGSKWQSDCKSCMCHGGMINCQPLMCPKVMCSHPARLRDECCEQCQGKNKIKSFILRLITIDKLKSIYARTSRIGVITYLPY